MWKGKVWKERVLKQQGWQRPFKNFGELRRKGTEAGASVSRATLLDGSVAEWSKVLFFWWEQIVKVQIQLTFDHWLLCKLNHDYKLKNISVEPQINLFCNLENKYQVVKIKLIWLFLHKHWIKPVALPTKQNWKKLYLPQKQ